MKKNIMEMKAEEYVPPVNVYSDKYPEVKKWAIGDKVSFMVTGVVESLRKEDDMICASVKPAKPSKEKTKKVGIPMEAYKEKDEE